MKTLKFAAVLASAITIARAQQMPDCATNCLGIFLPQSACNATDFACLCTDEPFMASVQGCTLSTCTIKEALSARNATANLCGEPMRDNTVVTPIVTGASGALAIAMVIMRIGDRLPHPQRLQWADLCVIVSLLFAIPMGVLEFIMAADGFGKDIWTIPFDQITRIVKFTWLTEIFYMVAIGLTKAAILLLYIRVFSSRAFHITCYVALGFTAAFILAFSFGVVFHCMPIEFGWVGWARETEGHCINFNAFAWSHAIVNIVFDLFIIVLPVPQLLKLSLGRRKKFHLLLMFSVGFFITIVSVVRLTALVSFANTANPTYDNVPTAYWSVLEAFVSIICCCMPACRAFLRRLFPSCFGSTMDPESQTTQPSQFSSSAMQSSDTKKAYAVSVEPRSGDSDTIELTGKPNKVDNQHSGWQRIPEPEQNSRVSWKMSNKP